MYNGPLHYNITTQTTSTVANSNVHITREEEGIGAIAQSNHSPAAAARVGAWAMGKARIRSLQRPTMQSVLRSRSAPP